MLTKDQIVEKARSLDFEDIGFTTAEPFESQKEVLQERREAYAWAMAAGLDLMAGTDPRSVLPDAQTVIVLMEVYFRQAFPAAMEPFFGRCYLDDDRVTRDGLAVRIKAFRSFLRDNGIQSKVPFHLPHRLAAARAGMGTFGKNCLFYSNAVARQSSWVLPIAVVVDAEFQPGTPTLDVACPDWCKKRLPGRLPHGRPAGTAAHRPAPLHLFFDLLRPGDHPPGTARPHGVVDLRMRPVPEYLPAKRRLAGGRPSPQPPGRG